MHWRLKAACIGADPELFFVNDETAKRRARGICAACPVRLPCLKSAMLNERAEDPTESADANRKKRYGIFGGVTSLERWSSVYPEEAADLRSKAAAKRRRQRREKRNNDLSTVQESWSAER